jgi:hypothetical protein
MFKVGDYNIEIVDNRDDIAGLYDLFYSDGSEYSNASSYIIKIYTANSLYKSACIKATAGTTGLYEHSFIVEKSRIVICCANVIFCLAIPDLSLVWQTEADTATCFQIFPYQQDYIIHGELEITRLNYSGYIVWQQSGADVFVTPNSTESFLITEKYIEVKDWNLKIYRFDFDGNNYIEL